MIISIIFSSVVYRVGSNNLSIDLAREGQELSKAFPVFNGTQYVRPSPKELNLDRQHLMDQLILINVLVLVGGGIICYLLAIETLKPIEEAHEQQKRFTADVSHELRTPLTALKMESEVALMDESLSVEDFKKVVISNIEEASKLETLINNLMKLSRLEASKIQSHFNKLELTEIIKEARDQVMLTANNKNISIKLKCEPTRVNGDKDSLIQMLVIFLDNSIKYSDQNTTITIKCDNKPQPWLEIIDHGKGIQAESLEHIFDRFYRADNSRTGNSGFGLGLSIAKQIGDLHKANIIISSQLGKGTKVKVVFDS